MKGAGPGLLLDANDGGCKHRLDLILSSDTCKTRVPIISIRGASCPALTARWMREGLAVHICLSTLTAIPSFTLALQYPTHPILKSQRQISEL